MLKRINIQSLLQAKDSLKNESFETFLKYHGAEIRKEEIEDLRVLTKALNGIQDNAKIFDQFHVGYKIPQIGKEFDLLRFGASSIINIELKNNSTEEKVKRQLERNSYYLSFLGRTVHTCTFVCESQKLYFLNQDKNLMETSLESLAKLLVEQVIAEDTNPDELFDPSDYLVSPFNSTKKFLTNAYFLTQQQEDVKREILDLSQLPDKERFISIIGGAGTGKTLLTYDIAKQLLEAGKKPLIFHCGQLNDGHHELIKNGWAIDSIKNYKKYDLKDYQMLIIDEAQRIYSSTLIEIISKVKLANFCCIFSHDKSQTLANWEERNNASGAIALIDSIKQYKLSEKIRTNKEISAFILMLFNSKKNLPLSRNGNIQVNYFSTSEFAKKYLNEIDESKWEILRFTPSQYKQEHHVQYSEKSNKTSHQVIGQEFDGVAVTIDKFFKYDEFGDLVYGGGTYYAAPKMLLQNITRSRKRLNLVIIGNEEVLNRCISILQ